MIRRFLIWLIRPLVFWITRPFVGQMDIRDVMVGLGDRYTPVDQYRDFVGVFGTEEGKRVLTQILIWGRVSKSNYSKNVDIHEICVLEGQRNLALKILAALQPVTPVEQETEQRRKP